MNISIEKFCSMIKSNENKKHFDLPTIQRGFVWKPYQIENLWDSLARNFPIGTFIVDDSSENIQILDGQQRASAIAIGYKGKDSKSVFNLKDDNFMRLFVDMAKPSQETDKKFTFRMITRSHPWGYQLKDSEKPLTVADRRNALDVFNAKEIIKNDTKYYNVKNKEKFFPYDCYLPVPVELFFQNNKQDVITGVINWLKTNFEGYIEIINKDKIEIIPNKFLEFYKKDKDRNNFIQNNEVPTKGLLEIYKTIYKEYKNELKKKNPKDNLETQIKNAFAQLNSSEEQKKEEYISFYTIDELYNIINNIKSYQLVFSNLTNSRLTFGNNSEKNTKRTFNEEEKTNDIEIIFQRLNRGGTPISEDDLTFSLFKSSLGKDEDAQELLKKFIDNCEKLISPSRLFRLAYLSWEQSKKYKGKNFKNDTEKKVQINSKKYELAYQRIKYKLAKNDFDNQEFKDFLTNHFTDNKDNYFKKFKKIFLYSDENNNGLPYPLFIQRCNSAPELVFLMMYRLNIKGDYNQVKNNEKNKKLMIGFLLGLYWFFKGKNEKSYTPLLRIIWPLVSFAPLKNCWSTELLQRCNLMYDYDEIDNYIFDKLNEVDKLNKYYYNSNEEKYLNIFRDSILYKNDLVLYAQRNELNSMFNNNNIFSLEDNSVPYDFDHICPSSYRTKRSIHKTIKELLDDIGNFRAWPYELNRSDQDDSIPDKFNFTSHKNIFNKYGIKSSQKLKKLSLVDKWDIDNYKEKNLKSKKDIIDSLCNNIKNRSYLIYSMWYNLIKPIYNTNKKLLDYDKIKIKLVNKINRFNNAYITYNNNYEELIINDFITVCLCEQNIKSNKDYEDAKIEKEFKFTLASYSEASFDHLCDEIEKTIADYKKNPKNNN